jgi:hypothetical protein
MYNSFKVVGTCNYNAVLKKVKNIVDHICMYNVYKLLYRRPIFNSLATIIPLTNFLITNFLMCEFIKITGKVETKQDIIYLLQYILFLKE